MGANSNIGWTNHTFNLWWGCTKVSDGCDHCYAETFAKRTGHKVWGKDKRRRTLSPKYYSEPRKWNREAAKLGEIHRVFCMSMGDLCDPAGYPELLCNVLWPTIKATPNLYWLLLTKLPGRLPKILPPDWESGYRNVMLMTSAENQEWFDRRLETLLNVPARAYGVSVEPMLGPITLKDRSLFSPNVVEHFGNPMLGWVIIGGESGANAREFRIEWGQALVNECSDSTRNIPVFVKQLGQNATSFGQRCWPVNQKNTDMLSWPVALRRQEFPR